MEEKNVRLFTHEGEEQTGHQADIRERIEELLEEKMGFFVSLQENVDEEEDEYEVYVHTDAYEDLSDTEIEQLDAAGITDNPSTATRAILTLLNIKVDVIGDYEKSS